MEFGIHLPQIGGHVTPEMVGEAAKDAEALGFDSIWINDHLAVPADAPYPPAEILEPLITLTWAAAQTAKIGLGTSVLLLALRHPIHLAKELAALDRLSKGRLILGAGVGWLEGEFEALGIPFAERGPRTDETIDLLRAALSQDPIQPGQDPTLITAKTAGIRAVPLPERKIPIWIGGNSAPAQRRAIQRGDGWHGLADQRLPIDELQKIVTRLRGERGPDFKISLRTFWDGLKDDRDELKAKLDRFAEIGVDALITEPRQRDADKRKQSVEAMFELCAPYRTGA